METNDILNIGEKMSMRMRNLYLKILLCKRDCDALLILICDVVELLMFDLFT